MARTRLIVMFGLLISLAGLSGTARANHRQESTLQDDQYLIYSSAPTVDSTLKVLHSLGVQRVRVTVLWADLAPAPGSPRRPPSFNSADPDAYPPGAWQRYDELVRLAARHRIGVEFNVTAPGPLWAMAPDSPTQRAANHWIPNAAEFGRFTYAVGLRYSGGYHGLPAVRAWSIWNEPNQPGWLAPQWVGSGTAQTLLSARLYRAYVQAGFRALLESNHSPHHDTILLGELAPEGASRGDFNTASTPMPFLRALYCVDQRYRPLQGLAAAALGCPAGGGARAFAQANPGLFQASGFAHHPYFFFRAPGVGSPDPDAVPLANLRRLETGLDAAFSAYGVSRRIPIYLTEYGYQTNPPDPYQSVTPRQQARFLNEADHIAWRDGRVRSVAQFLLYDSPPDTRFPSSDFEYWDTFQTGLLFADGRPKPALDAYRVQIWIAHPRVRRGHKLHLWGQVRAAAGHRLQRAAVQWRGRRGRFRTIALVRTSALRGFISASLALRHSGQIRISWRSRSGAQMSSRSVPVSVV